MRNLLIGFLAGAVIVGGTAFWCEIKHTQEFGQALKLLKSGEEASAYTRAMSAYRDGDPSIAIWELTHLVALEKEELDLGVQTNGPLAELMLTHARLAKLYHHQGREAEAQTNADEAICFMRKLPRPDTTVTNLATLLVRLQEFDAREKQRRSRE